MNAHRRKRKTNSPSSLLALATSLVILVYVVAAWWKRVSYTGSSHGLETVQQTYMDISTRRNDSSVIIDRAYVFYASNDAYACGALINMARLRRLDGGMPEGVGLILLASDVVSSSIRDIATNQLDGMVYNLSSFGGEYHMAPSDGHSPHYSDSFAKFLAFLLTPYKRLIVMDADSLILRPPHHLLALSELTPYAAPKAYWYENATHLQDTAFWKVPGLKTRPDFLTTWLLSVSRIIFPHVDRLARCSSSFSLLLHLMLIYIDARHLM